MAERTQLLVSIANIIKDYRAGEIAEPDAAHVNRWISQFDQAVQIPMLRELTHVLRQTYYPKTTVVNRLRKLAYKPPSGSIQSPRSFWERAHILDIQQNGESQVEIRGLFGSVLDDEFGLDVDKTATDAQTFVYLDDAIFTGNRIIQDLSHWMPESPSTSTLYICVIVSHTGGEYWCESRVQQIAAASGKDVNLKFWKFKLFENRKYYRNSADVLWPTNLPDDDSIQAYMADDSHQFEFRKPIGHPEQTYFSSEAGRKILEDEFLRAGVHILNSHHQVSQPLKPLGFSTFEPGFGSMLIFYRNCPNNCPLALWWSLGQWYPLFPRKTYQQ